MTIKDLAAQTGYSVGTISRALNNQPNVSEKARSAILRAAAECGFQLNANAKQLKQQHGNSILVIVKGRSNELFSSLVENIQSLISATNYPLDVDYIDEDANEVRRAVQLCLEKKPLGVLFLGGNRENFEADFDKIRMPCVLVTNDASGLSFPNLSSVTSDDTHAGKMAIDHLVSLGHKDIVIIGGDPETSDMTAHRYAGCREAFCQHQIDFDPEQNYEAIRYSFSDGYKAAQRLLEKGKHFSALFAMSDVMAIGAIRALQDAGKRIPEDVSVLGLDGLLIGEYTIPRLSTIVQSVEELASRSIRLLLESVEGKPTVRYETVPVTLNERESAKQAN